MSIRRLFVVCALAMTAFAAVAQEVNSVSTEVKLLENGDALVSQRWDAMIVQGTEWYIPVSNLGKMSISDFSVSENGSPYVNEGASWSSDRTLEEKAGRCGVVDKGSGGVELCWGQGHYGHHVYDISYRINGLVQSLQDYDAFNYRFVNPGMSGPPKNAVLRLINGTASPWTSDNTRFWGFGFYGNIDLKDGEIVAESSEPFSSESNMTVMVRFDKGMFSPTLSRDIPFEKMQKKAFKGSSYASSSSLAENIFIILACVLCIGGLLFLLIYIIVCQATGHKYKKSLFGRTKITDWYRDAPLEGSLPAAWYVYSNAFRFHNESKPDNLTGAYFLKWILDGVVKLRSEEGKRRKTSLEFTGKQPSDAEDERGMELYNMAVEAAGDKVLESSEFKSWSRKNYEQIIDWPSSVSDSGLSWLFSHGYMASRKDVKKEKTQDVVNVIGLKNFLDDFTLSKERVARDVSLWKHYLVYAQMFGIADKVAKQFKNLYPDFFQELASDTGLDTRNLLYAINYTNRMSASSYATALAKQTSVDSKAAGGFGGGTSFGGGGGFSGGGFGGGSR